MRVRQAQDRTAVSEPLTELHPERPIEGAVLDGFADVLGSDGLGLGEVGDAPGDFQDATAAVQANLVSAATR